MSLVRILVDGYSVLHKWPELAPGKPWFSVAARDALVEVLTHYRDVTGTPITVFFDGAGGATRPGFTRSTPAVEVLYSCAGKTADQMIERTVHRMVPHGEVLVVTDDRAEQETVLHLGALTASSDNFLQMIQSALVELQRDLKHHNLRERRKFCHSR